MNNVTKNDVTLQDKSYLGTALASVVKSLQREDELTSAEKALLQQEKAEIEAALKVIENVEAVVDKIITLPKTAKPDNASVVDLAAKARSAYNALTSYEKAMVAKSYIDKLATLEASLNAYAFIEGENQSWTKDSGKTLKVVVNGLFSKFKEVKIDGKTVSSSNYKAESGSTIITFKATYLNGLAEGKHSVEVVYTDGSVKTTLTIVMSEEPETESKEPETEEPETESKEPETEKPKPEEPEVEGDLVKAFVTRLYNVCLNRQPDAGGLADWIGRLTRKEITGVTAAHGFVFSREFMNLNLCDEDYVEQLYKAFMGRNSDAGGKAYWVGNLKNGMTREEVFNGFALSVEFQNLCSKYEIAHGQGIAIPVIGTKPAGTCSICGKDDDTTLFVKRLYSVCLNREADAGGLAYWVRQLKDKTNTGRGVAYGFIFSPEFVSKEYDNSTYVEYLYQAMMGRASDPAGKADWINRMETQGWSREAVFDGFVGSREFTDICNSYGIVRD